MISVGPTKVDLNIQYTTLLGANIFPFDSSDQMLHAN